LGSFFYVFENAVGNVHTPQLYLWTEYLDSQYLPTLDYFGIEVACFFVYFIWFINQYWMYVILLSFLIAVIMNEYNDMQFKKVIYTYKQKSELNRQCLIYNEAWGSNLQMWQLILSANTEDTHYNYSLNSLMQSVQKSMINSELDVKSKIKENAYIIQTQVKEHNHNILEQVRLEHETSKKKVQRIIDTYEEALAKK